MGVIATAGTASSHNIFNITRVKAHFVFQTVEHLCHAALRMDFTQAADTGFAATAWRTRRINYPGFSHDRILLLLTNE
jgi:hypothetical protein